MARAIGAVFNAVGDRAARRAGVPLWKLLGDADPEWLVSQVDFRYLTDALTAEEALATAGGRTGATDLPSSEGNRRPEHDEDIDAESVFSKLKSLKSNTSDDE